MIRVCIICEGQTEQRFVEDCVKPFLAHSGVDVYTSLLAGSVSSQRIARFVRSSFNSFDFLTTFVDFYGYENSEARNRAELESEIMAAAQVLFKSVSIQRKFKPYVQMYEFEALLFSEVSEFDWVQEGWSDESLQKLQAIRATFGTPEEINNSIETAPSKRLYAIFAHHFDKLEHGPIIAESIGLDRIREACPNFDEWVSWLESLSEEQAS